MSDEQNNTSTEITVKRSLVEKYENTIQDQQAQIQKLFSILNEFNETHDKLESPKNDKKTTPLPENNTSKNGFFRSLFRPRSDQMRVPSQSESQLPRDSGTLHTVDEVTVNSSPKASMVVKTFENTIG